MAKWYSLVILKSVLANECSNVWIQLPLEPRDNYLILLSNSAQYFTLKMMLKYSLCTIQLRNGLRWLLWWINLQSLNLVKLFLKNKNNFFAKNHCEFQVRTILVCTLYTIKYGNKNMYFSFFQCFLSDTKPAFFKASRAFIVNAFWGTFLLPTDKGDILHTRHFFEQNNTLPMDKADILQITIVFYI